MEYHPIAEIWPLMTEDEISHLAEDIKAQGQLNPIWIYEDKILDGRNRYQACLLIGITPLVERYNGDNPVQFAFSQNEERRHLSSGQRAALAVEIKPRLEEEARKRQGHGLTAPGKTLVEKVPQVKEEGKSRYQAAKITGTNEKYVNAAEKIKEQAPDVFEKLKTGKITMQDAKREASRKPTTDEWLPDELERRKAVEAGSAVLANYERDKHLIQWAEQKGLLISIDRGSKWGNPFLLGADGDRKEVCLYFHKHYFPFKKSLRNNKAILELDGKVLACHCYPEQCHGQTLIRYLSGLD